MSKLKYPLEGLRILEIADEKAEYCGLLLASLGAEVIKVEPPEGNSTRKIGPFYQDIEAPDRSLYFWSYNRGKKSIVLDLNKKTDQNRLDQLLSTVDILLESTPKGMLEAAGFVSDELLKKYPTLIHARITDFGDDGPWASYKACDLTHLALGGVMMNCGYDPRTDGTYDLPPIAPQVWHAYHLSGEQMLNGILGALIYRFETGEGQKIDLAVHEACAKGTESDLMSWVMLHTPFLRQTGRHATPEISDPTYAQSKDGRWLSTIIIQQKNVHDTARFLDKYGLADDLAEYAREPFKREAGVRTVPGAGQSFAGKASAMRQSNVLTQGYCYKEVPWQEAQLNFNLQWAPIVKPHENIKNPHWQKRGTYNEVEHPELGRSFVYPTSKWISTATEWKIGRRAPLLNEDEESVFTATPSSVPVISPNPDRVDSPDEFSSRGKPFAIKNVKVFDFGWFLASAGGTRFTSALGAESIKVEHKSHSDTRMAAMSPVGGREAREKATGPIKGVTDPDMGGQFNNKNPGKLGMSLNIVTPEGLEIAKKLIAQSDVVTEGFSIGVLEKWGLGYEELKKINPNIIVCKQSGMGSTGVYGRMRTTGPIAAAFAGITEMSGLPEPAPPCGIGYSYLDWIGAFSFASSILSALFYRMRTGEGQYIDASQTETGIFLTGVASLQWSANHKTYQRSGNRSPFKKAAPHGAYQCAGDDRWIALGCFNEEEWQALIKVAGAPEWSKDPLFASFESRYEYQDELDEAVGSWTINHDAYDLMEKLQAAGVPAGVCQTAEDRCEHDPQLVHLEWLTEVTGTKIGRWPVVEMSAHLSKTPAHAGGLTKRGAPCYGEDNERILTERLGLTKEQVADLTKREIL